MIEKRILNDMPLDIINLFFKDVPTLDYTTEQTVAQMLIVDTVIWKQTPVWTVKLDTQATGVNQVMYRQVCLL